MTNELEKQGLVSSDKRARISGADDSSSLLEIRFFDTFGIEPKLKTFAIKQDEQGYLTYPPIYEYPQISDRILLELICIVSERRILPSCDVNGLKEYVLKELCTMIMSEEAKHQVRTLF